MEEYKVFIPTSGVGSRLGDITKYTNKSLVRVGKKPAISYIIESYPEETKFVISLGYFGDQVKQFLELVYPNRNFEFVTVDKYEGQDSSLLYSISKAKNLLQCPFIFHACDTIIDNHVFSLKNNFLVGHRPTDNSQYRSFNVRNDKITKINDKGESKYDFDYVGIFFIKNYKIFWDCVEKCLINNNNNSSDYDVIDLMIKEKNSFDYHIVNKWYDIGNMFSLAKARKEIYDKFEILDKNDESIFIFENFVIKFFYDKKICLNRVKRTNILNPTTPKILDFRDNFYKYKYAEGELLSEVANPENISLLLNWAKDNLWIPNKKQNNFDELCYDFYFKKTNQRIQKLFKENNMVDQEEIINGIKIPKISDLLSKIDIKQFCNVKSYRFHGDFILDNILIKDDNFTLIDWRQDFAGSIEDGDIYYDLGKLNHNLIFNHELVNKNNFTIKKNNSNIYCDILVSKNLLDCKKQLEIFCKKNNFDYKKVELMSSIIWINMAPLHIHPLSEFLFYFGKYNLFLNLQK